MPALVGLMLAIVGAGYVTVNPPVSTNGPPPGPAFVTVTFLAPAVAPAGTVMFAVI